ncbi:MAG: S8 family serine peptidase [Melioribacteraceae bacterium]|nr:S8 family serine peptidase [Melioribacteraceae bacterium]
METYPEYDGRGTLILIMDSGVDIGIDGLTTTTTDEKKVIDVQDFTGEGDFKFYEADYDTDDDTLFFYNENEDLKVKVHKNNLLLTDEDYFIGAIDEVRWKNSSSRTTDINNNGSADDKFVFIVYKPSDSENWIVYIDSNTDGKLDDENPLSNYKIDYDTFQIEPEDGEPKYTFGLNIFPEETKVVFHFDAVAHGTHCAGIATGNQIGNAEFYGVAPGAYMGSLKIGSSIFSGGATVTGSMKAAYDYADKLSKELEMPVIINMSYGIGSEIHAESDMEKYLENLVSANPYLYISLSAGNEGPGVSTLGLPSSTQSIMCSGAVLTKEVGHDLYGAPINKDVILHFSSRGGEVAKPDLVSPGAATSTVPFWTRGDRFWGTSMAAPYTAGVMSLLLSAVKAEYPDVKVPSLLLYRALREGAVEMDEYSPVDQGGGMINVMNAYQLLKKFIEAGEIDKFENYKVTSAAPSSPTGSAHSLYIRNGSYLSGVEKFSFNVRRGFFNKAEKFFRSYVIESDSDWLIPITNKTYIRNDQRAEVVVSLDKSKMTKPGLYSGKIKGYRDDASKFPEFEAYATVIIPHQFCANSDYKKEWSGKLAPAEVERFFINVPPSASTMKVKLWYDDGDYSNTWYAIHDPEGRGYDSIRPLESEKDEMYEENIYFDIQPGIYEIDVVGFYRAVDSVAYNLSVEFTGLEIISSNVVDTLSNTIELVNNYNKVLRYDINGEILGYEKESSIQFTDEEIIKIPFTLNKDQSQKVFNLSMSQQDFNTFTDFSVNIYDEDGKVVSSNAFGYKYLTVTLQNSYEGSNEFTMQLVPAFVDEIKAISIFVNEQTDFKEPMELKLTHEDDSSIELYPSIPETIRIDFEYEKLDSQEDQKPYGKIYLENNRTEEVEFEIPVYFNL